MAFGPPMNFRVFVRLYTDIYKFTGAKLMWTVRAQHSVLDFCVDNLFGLLGRPYINKLNEAFEVASCFSTV